MKTEKIITLGLALVIAIALIMNVMTLNQLVGSGASAPNVLSVEGSGEIKVQPDIAVINIGLETRDAVAAQAQEKNNIIMNEVMAAMKELGIEEKDIKTEYYNMYRGYDYNTGGEAEFYIVNNTLKITVRTIGDVGKAIDRAVALGANQVNSIQFTLSEDADLYREALALAIEDADAKAQGLALATGKPLKGVLSIEESTSQSPVYVDYGYGREAVSASPIETGELQIRAMVRVTYEY